MDEISKTAEVVAKELATNSKKSQSTTSEKTGLRTSWVSAIFAKLQNRYLHKWSSAIEGREVEVVKEWADGLAGLTGDQIKNGLDSWNDDWPPTLPEFRKACTGKGKNEFGLDYVPEYHRPAVIVDEDRLLSGPDRDRRREEGKAKIRAIKEGMAKGRDR